MHKAHMGSSQPAQHPTGRLLPGSTFLGAGTHRLLHYTTCCWVQTASLKNPSGTSKILPMPSARCLASAGWRPGPAGPNPTTVHRGQGQGGCWPGAGCASSRRDVNGPEVCSTRTSVSIRADLPVLKIGLSGEEGMSERERVKTP